MHSNDSGFRWFYQQAQTKQLTGTAQRFWCYLYDRLGIAHANHFYEMSSKALSQELGVCLKSVERARKALQQAGFLHYEVRGKSVYYMLLLPEIFFLSQADSTSTTALQHNKNIVASKEEHRSSFVDIQPSQQIVVDMQPAENNPVAVLQQLAAWQQEYARLIAQLQVQLAGQCQYVQEDAYTSAEEMLQNYSCHDAQALNHEQNTQAIAMPEKSNAPQQNIAVVDGSPKPNHASIELAEHPTAQHETEAEENNTQSLAQNETSINGLLGFHGDSLQDKVYTKILQSRQFLDKPALEVLPAQPLVIYTSADYCTYKHQGNQNKLSDILFNDKYEILLWDYLDKYKDNRFAEACYNHFAMVKELYRRKGKKQLTEFGFYNIMEQLEELSEDDMIKKLAIMERSLRNGWVGFFPLPDNTPEHHKMEKKKQGRKRSSYRKHYGNEGSHRYRSKFNSDDGVDLSFLEE